MITISRHSLSALAFVSVLSLAALSPTFAAETAAVQDAPCGLEGSPQQMAADEEAFKRTIACIETESAKRMAEVQKDLEAARKDVKDAMNELNKTPLGGLIVGAIGSVIKDVVTAQAPQDDPAPEKPDICKAKLLANPDNQGVSGKMFNLLRAKDEAAAYRKLSKAFQANAPEIGFGNHMDMLMWPGRRLSDAQGLTTNTVTTTTCTDGNVVISEHTSFVLDGTPAATAVIETIEETGDWKVDSIKVVKTP